MPMIFAALILTLWLLAACYLAAEQRTPGPKP